MIRPIMRTISRLAIVLVLTVPIALVAQSRPIPSPESVFGFAPGADLKLATYDQVLAYFKQVDAVSDRVRLVEAGTTSQGRTFFFALVSSPANLANIDRLREVARRLAHPEGLTDDEARKLAREGKAFVHIDGGLHSSEVAGPQHTPLLLETHDRDLRAGGVEPPSNECGSMGLWCLMVRQRRPARSRQAPNFPSLRYHPCRCFPSG